MDSFPYMCQCWYWSLSLGGETKEGEILLWLGFGSDVAGGGGCRVIFGLRPDERGKQTGEGKLKQRLKDMDDPVQTRYLSPDWENVDSTRRGPAFPSPSEFKQSLDGGSLSRPAHISHSKANFSLQLFYFFQVPLCCWFSDPKSGRDIQLQHRKPQLWC